MFSVTVILLNAYGILLTTPLELIIKREMLKEFSILGGTSTTNSVQSICIFREIWKSWTGYKYGDHKQKIVTSSMQVHILWNIKAVIFTAVPNYDTTGTWLNFMQELKGTNLL